MAKENKYSMYKKSPISGEIEINSTKLQGFKIKPRNKINYEGILVDRMVLIKPSFIEKVLKRKIKNKLNLYLQYMIQILEDEDTDPDGLRIALNDLERYKRTIINNYRKYLDEKYIELLLKKIALLEREYKVKLVYEIDNYEYEEEYTSKKSR